MLELKLIKITVLKKEHLGIKDNNDNIILLLDKNDNEKGIQIINIIKNHYNDIVNNGFEWNETELDEILNHIQEEVL